MPCDMAYQTEGKDYLTDAGYGGPVQSRWATRQFHVMSTESPFWTYPLPKFLQIHPRLSGAVILVLGGCRQNCTSRGSKGSGVIHQANSISNIKNLMRSGQIDIFSILRVSSTKAKAPSILRFWTLFSFNVTVLSLNPFSGSLIASLENTLTLYPFLIMNKTVIQTLRNFPTSLAPSACNSVPIVKIESRLCRGKNCASKGNDALSIQHVSPCYLFVILWQLLHISEHSR